MKYSTLIIDSMNLGYMVFNSLSSKNLSQIGEKLVYKNFVKEYVETVDYLKSKYLEDNFRVYLLFDNHTSREDIKKLFKPLSENDNRKEVNPEYKSNRTNEKKEFYNSLDLVKYYYTQYKEGYFTVRIPNLEADDLVPNAIQHARSYDKSFQKILLVTNDSDWCKHLSSDIDYLPELYKEPFTYDMFARKHKYFPSENKIILDKLLNGDKADNVKPVIPELSSYEKEYIMAHFDSIEDFLFGYSEHPSLVKHSSLIKSREKDFIVAYQMLATINVSQNHFNVSCTQGRNSENIRKALDSILGLTDFEQKKKFQFGALKVPRVIPKES